MSRVFKLAAAVGMIAGATAAAGGAAAAPADNVGAAAAWRQSKLWDDGNAEVCAYEVTWPRYGHQHAGRALLILVKEPWAPDLAVKADTPRADGFDVLKLNHVRDVATGIYTYHQMASVYFRRGNAALEKLAATSSEACGVSTGYLRDGVLELRSYFDGIADRRLDWPRGALPEDALPALLRDWVAGGDLPAELLVFPSLLDARLAAAAPRRMNVTRREVEALAVPGGTFAAVELRLEGEGRSLAYRFDREPPHVLLELEGDDGTRYRMARCGRIRYWEMHDPGGEEWLPATVR